MPIVDETDSWAESYSEETTAAHKGVCNETPPPYSSGRVKCRKALGGDAEKVSIKNKELTSSFVRDVPTTGTTVHRSAQTTSDIISLQRAILWPEGNVKYFQSST